MGGGRVMESGKYGREWYNDTSREFLVEKPSPRKTTYYGTTSTTKVKEGKRHNVQAYIMKSRAI
jgi:hypothetical protein